MEPVTNQSGEALELIRYNVDTGKFQVGEKAMNILREIRTPLSVVAVCGRARQGKSFILNQLLQVTGGFQIGSTTRPCTKGLWMWSTPQKRVDEDNNEHHVVRVLCHAAAWCSFQASHPAAACRAVCQLNYCAKRR